MTARDLSAHQVATMSQAADPDGEGITHRVVSDIRRGRRGPRGPVPRTVKLLVAALELDAEEVDRALGAPTRRSRSLPDDFHRLTDQQWATLCETARLFRLANERRGDASVHHLDSGRGAGVSADGAG